MLSDAVFVWKMMLLPPKNHLKNHLSLPKMPEFHKQLKFQFQESMFQLNHKVHLKPQRLTEEELDTLGNLETNSDPWQMQKLDVS